MTPLFLRLCLLFTICLSTTTTAAAEAKDDGPNFDFKNMMDKDCPNFRCTSGLVPTPKSRPKFESTGCSSMGGGAVIMQAGAGSNEKPYESCCDQWHACYQTCGASKKQCDSAFETCAKPYCTSGRSKEEDQEKCTKDLELSNLMMKLTGCKKFEEAQYQACECTATGKASSKRETAIRNFYKKHAPENVDKAKGLAEKADTPSKYAGLFKKLLLKYPEAIVKKEDSMQSMFDKLKLDREGEAKPATKVSENREENEVDDSADEERIEL